MKLTVKHQEEYSRGELLLRSFFGAFYIALPHGFLLFFMSIWSAILQFVAFWIVLFTGKYPQSMFEFQVGLMKWNLRVTARLYNLADGYPAFGIGGADEHTDLQVEYPEKISRGLVIVRALFGLFYVMLPHMFILIFYSIWCQILIFVAWWIVLFTGKFPESMHETIVGLIRWQTRINLYMGYMTDAYPPFSGKE